MNKEKLISFINRLTAGKGSRTSRAGKTTNPYTLDGIANKETDDRYMNIAISKRNWLRFNNQNPTFGL